MRKVLVFRALLLSCLLPALPAEAAERIIRPRRVNRAAPKVLAPIGEDGTAQPPLPGLTPPDSAIWPPPAPPAGNGAEDTAEQPEPSKRQAEATSAPEPRQRAAGAHTTIRPRRRNPFAAPAGEGKDARTSQESAPPVPEESASPISVPEDGREEVQQRRQDFAAPLTEEIRNRPAPPSRPAGMAAARENAEAPEYHEPLAEAREENGAAARAAEETAALPAAPEGTAASSPEATGVSAAADAGDFEEETLAGAARPSAGDAPDTTDSAGMPAAPLRFGDTPVEARAEALAAQPTPAEVENYRRRLEFRLLERYNNLPQHAGNVGKVTVLLSKPLQPSLDGTRLRAEFDQLVYDPWGKRIPALEKEYFVVTFGSGGARQVRSDPSVRVGLNYERTYSEPGPASDIGEKIRRIPSDHAFRAAARPEEPAVRMPDWWRPEFADDGY